MPTKQTRALIVAVVLCVTSRGQEGTQTIDRDIHLGVGLFSPLTYHPSPERTGEVYQYLLFGRKKLNHHWSFEGSIGWGEQRRNTTTYLYYSRAAFIDVGGERIIRQGERTKFFVTALLGYNHLIYEWQETVGGSYELSIRDRIHMVGVGPGLGMRYFLTKAVFVETDIAGQFHLRYQLRYDIRSNETEKANGSGFFWNRQLSFTIGFRVH